jgi:hypothetical protein
MARACRVSSGRSVVVIRRRAAVIGDRVPTAADWGQQLGWLNPMARGHNLEARSTSGAGLYPPLPSLTPPPSPPIPLRTHRWRQVGQIIPHAPELLVGHVGLAVAVIKVPQHIRHHPPRPDLHGLHPSQVSATVELTFHRRPHLGMQVDARAGVRGVSGRW